METNNETVEHVYAEMMGWEHHTWMCSSDHEYIECLAKRVLAAHERKLAAKDAEIESLRALVKELADALEMEIVCHKDCSTMKVCATVKRCDSRENRALVAKAREVCK